MYIAIITRTLPPEYCGIGDHTMLLANSLRLLGHKVTLIAGQGEGNDNSLIVEDKWGRNGLDMLLRQLDGLSIDHLILQYIPYGFITGTKNRNPCSSIIHYVALKKFWKTCGRKWQTSIIVHETYYRVWSYPPSWIKGSIQKYLMTSLL